MAIDSRQKRSSVVHMGCPWRSQLPVGDGTIAQSDRQQILGYYGGIAWSTGLIEETDNVALSDSVTTAAIYNITVTDSVAIADTPTVQGTATTIDEETSLGITDVVTTAAIYNRSLTDNVAVGDTYSAGDLTASVSNSAGLTDRIAIIGGGLLSVTAPPPWWITNIPATRALAKGTATLDDVAYLVATMVYDYVNGWDGTAYSLTGGTIITAVDGDTITANLLFDWAYTLVEYNPFDWHARDAVAVTNITPAYVMDCSAVNGGNEIAKILAALAGAWSDPYCTIACAVTRDANWVGSCATDITIAANSLNTDVGMGCGNQ